MSDEKEKDQWKKEHKKCLDSPYYFYINYFIVDGKPATTNLSETEFNRLANLKPIRHARRKRRARSE